MRREYITAPVLVSVFGPISVKVLNHGAMTELVRIGIHYRNAGGVGVLIDTGDVELIATGTYSAGIAAVEEGDYWVQIHTSSEFLIPSATFQNPPSVAAPTIIYSPGDFAVFEFGRRRI